jgi:DNA-binding NarL/FixJ family response regulator
MKKTLAVAVAEDIEILRKDFCRMLDTDENFFVAAEAENGRRLVEEVRKKDIDIIMTDIAMENPFDGIDAIKTIFEFKPDMAVLFLTIHDDDETIYKAFSATQNVNYLLKSADHEEIKKALKELHNKEAFLNPFIAEKLKNEFFRLKRNEENLFNFVDILGTLTVTERTLIKLLLENKKVYELAEERCVELGTIKTQIGTLLKKFSMRRSKEIIKMIRKLKLERLFLRQH